MAQDSPRAEYERRLHLHQEGIARLDRLDRRLANARLAVAAVGAVLLWPTVATRTWSPLWLLPILLAFAGLAVAHARTRRKLEHHRFASTFYSRGVARISEEVVEPLDDGARFEADGHLYAEDLDLLGPGSLYSRLCTANSVPGREVLAEWLLYPAPPGAIAWRQEAVQELSGKLDLQEDLSVLAAGLSPRLSVEDLEEWGAAPLRLRGLGGPALAFFLALLNVGAFLAWSFGPLEGRVLLLVFGFSAALGAVLRARVSEVLSGLGMPATELRFLSRLLARVESESFESASLRDLQGASSPGSDSRPSSALADLAKLIEWNDSRRNQFFQPISVLLLLGTQLAYAVERWRERHGGEIGEWLRAVGEFEALSALATFSFENPDYVFPEFVERPSVLEGENLVHPLLPRASRVANNVRLAEAGKVDGPPQLLLISGSNMSGKSTLLRTVGVAAVLAYAGAPVAAMRLRLSSLSIGASLQVHDSLLEGVSRFYAELSRLAAIRELAEAGPTLFLLDEILHGTNSHDRRLGAAGVVRGLLEAGALGLVTTHDLALAEVADELGPKAENVHFEDHLEEGRMAFDYKLRPGVVMRGNALALMKSLGLPVEE